MTHKSGDTWPYIIHHKYMCQIVIDSLETSLQYTNTIYIQHIYLIFHQADIYCKYHDYDKQIVDFILLFRKTYVYLYESKDNVQCIFNVNKSGHLLIRF